VFAVLSGMSGQRWQAVHDFCARTATPCLLPIVDLPPQTTDFYSVYFSRGVVAQAQEALRYVQSQPGLKQAAVRVLTPNTPDGAQQRAAIEQVIQTQGHKLVATGDTKNAVSVTLSTLSAEDTAALSQQDRRNIILLGGAKYVRGNNIANSVIHNEVSIKTAVNTKYMSVSDFVDGSAAQSALTRSRVWLNARGLKIHNPLIASNAMFVATLAVESLMHVDDKFSREYCIEKLEHNLENVPPMTAYERLSIGPKQRFASKQAHLFAASSTDTVTHENNPGPDSRIIAK
jgi:hypothetical protein